MSFASDQGLDPRREKVYESEAAFLLSAPLSDRRAFWKNALNRLTSFFKDHPEAAAVGLQEMNLTPTGSGTGSDAVSAACKAVRSTLEVETQTVPGFGGAPVGISMVWDTAIFGNKAKAIIVDLNYAPTELEGLKAQTGRPMLMVFTEKGYLLVSLHAPNQAVLSELTQRDLVENISIHILKNFPEITIEKLFITGDFNDRYDALAGRIDLPSLGSVQYAGRAPLSCCHNWDSSCTGSRYQPKTIASRTDVGTCDATGKILAGPGVREPMGDEGNIENYRYYGDKVFGANPATAIQIFPIGNKGPSQESDHEMVIAGFTINVKSTGASMRKRRTHRRRRSSRRSNQRSNQRSRRH